MPHAVTHPTPQELAAFGLGKLPERTAAAVAAHLESCPACRQAVAALPPDSFLGKVRAAGAQGSSFPPGLAQFDNASSSAGLPALPAVTGAEVPPELAASSKFEVLGKLGEGGMGAVWKARHRFLGELVAIKVMNAAALANPDARSRFLREMQAVGQLRHRNIVRALDAEEMGNLLLLVMEYVEGYTLDRLVEKKGVLPVAYSCQCIVQAAQGLQFAHEKKMVHRDIKPANLIVASKEGSVKLLDFGLARGPREQTAQGNQTRLGAVMGTPAYMAPEQANDASSADTRADIYSLGCTLYFLLAGQSPFQRDSALRTMMAQVEEEARPLPEVRPEVSGELWAVVAKILAKKPEERYQTPKEVEQALRPFVNSSPKSIRSGTGQPAGLADAGTLLPSDTRKQKPLPPPVPQAAPRTAMQEASPFALPPSTPEGRNKREPRRKKATKQASAGWSWRWPVLAGVGVLLLALVGLWASGVLKVKTNDGTIVLENLPADADVLVDGGLVTVQSRDGKSVEIRVDPRKKHRLEVKKDGFKVFGEEIEIDAGGRKSVVVRLEPNEPPPARLRVPDEKSKLKLAAPSAGALRFRIPADVEKPVSGSWEVRENELVQPRSPWGSRLVFGEKTWTDYDFTIEGQMTDRSCGFGMMVRNSGD
jgi:serine/threonine protein kinase